MPIPKLECPNCGHQFHATGRDLEVLEQARPTLVLPEPSRREVSVLIPLESVMLGGNTRGFVTAECVLECVAKRLVVSPVLGARVAVGAIYIGHRVPFGGMPRRADADMDEVCLTGDLFPPIAEVEGRHVVASLSGQQLHVGHMIKLAVINLTPEPLRFSGYLHCVTLELA